MISSAYQNQASQQAIMAAAATGAVSANVLSGQISGQTLMKAALESGAYSSTEVSAAGLDTVFDGRVVVSKAENGFVVTVALRHGGRYKTYVAADMDEVNRLLTSIMVDFRLTGGK